MSTYMEQVNNLVEVRKYTVDELLAWIESIYTYVIPEGGKEEGDMPFGLLDYYEMEIIGAFLKRALKGGEG